MGLPLMGSQEGAKTDEFLHVWGYLAFNDQKAVQVSRLDKGNYDVIWKLPFQMGVSIFLMSVWKL